MIEKFVITLKNTIEIPLNGELVVVNELEINYPKPCNLRLWKEITVIFMSDFAKMQSMFSSMAKKVDEKQEQNIETKETEDNNAQRLIYFSTSVELHDLLLKYIIQNGCYKILPNGNKNLILKNEFETLVSVDDACNILSSCLHKFFFTKIYS